MMDLVRTVLQNRQKIISGRHEYHLEYLQIYPDMKDIPLYVRVVKDEGGSHSYRFYFPDRRRLYELKWRNYIAPENGNEGRWVFERISYDLA